MDAAQNRIREEIREFARESVTVVEKGADWPGKRWNIKFDCEPEGCLWEDHDDYRVALRVAAHLRRGLRLRIEGLFVSLGLLTPTDEAKSLSRRAGKVIELRIKQAGLNLVSAEDRR